MKHKHWIFYAYDAKLNESYVEPVEVTVNDAETEIEALEEAKKILKRLNYTLRKVYECTQCFYQDRQALALNKLINLSTPDD